ncbi:MAG: hypothetical protein ACRDQB_02880 [Thermocrispum sp.]
MTEPTRVRAVPSGGRAAEPAHLDLPSVIDQLVDELSRAIGRAGHDNGHSRAIALRVLSGWLRANRRHLTEPAKADKAESLIGTLFRGSEDDGHDLAVDVAAASSAAERLAVALGDDFAMVVVWVAAGLDAQFE